MNFLRSFSYTFLTKVLSMVFLLFSRILLARLLGPSELGSFGNALNFTTFLARWSSLGTVPATQFISAKYSDASNEVLTITLAGSFILGIVCMTVIYLVPVSVIHWHFTTDLLAKAIFEKLALSLPVIILSMTLPIFLLGRGHYKAYTFSQIVPLVVQTGLLGFAFISEVPIKIVVIGQIAYWILMAGISWFPNRFSGFHFSINPKITTDFLRMAVKMFPLVLLQYGLARFSVLTGSHYLSTEDLGHFLLASNLSEAFLIVYTAMTPLVFNQALKSQSRPTLLIKAIRFSNILIVITLTIILTTGRSVFLYLFGEAYHLSWHLLIMLSPGIILHGIAALSINHFVATEKIGVVMYIYLAGIITLIVSCIFLCPRYGVSGLCFSSVLSYMATALICLFLIMQETNDKPGSLLFPEKADWDNLIQRISRKYH